MKITLAVKTLGGQSATSRLLNVSQGLVWQWVHGKSNVPEKYCLKIHKLTNGEVTCKDLRPDVDWDAVNITKAVGA